MNQLFFELIRVAIGTQDSLSRLPSEKEWKKLYAMAHKQSLVGVCFAGLKRLGADADEGFARVGMSKELYFDWMGNAFMIQQKNHMMDGNTKEVLAHFRKKGFACQVLKGQGIAKLYTLDGSAQSNSLAELRQSGDVDVWVAGDRKKLYEHAIKKFGKLEGLTYHHIHYPMFADAEVEAHVWPSFLSSPLRNRRLQVFCKMYEPREGCEDTPSLAFNRVFILLHCYQHFTRRGVGMRQILDYYFVLKASLQLSPEEKRECNDWIEKLGMGRFAEAMAWMMKEVFGLDERYLLCEPNEKYGRFLLDEVMETGNMGHADKRVNKKQLKSAGGRYLNNLKRDIRIMKICPHEAMWEPLWGIYQFVWCKLTQMKYDKVK